MNPWEAETILRPQRTGDLQADVQNFLCANGRQDTYAHGIAVAQQCRALAARHCPGAEAACACAGLLHDISAVLPPPQMLLYAESQIWRIDPAERAHPFLLHQRASRDMARALFGVEDARILSAIECHTTLRAAPSPEDLILFLADKLAWDQIGEPPFAQAIQSGLAHSLEAAALRYIEYVLSHGMILCPHAWLLEAQAFLSSSHSSI